MLNPDQIILTTTENPIKSWVTDVKGQLCLTHGMSVDIRTSDHEKLEAEVKKQIKRSIWHQVYGDFIPVVADLCDQIDQHVPPERRPCVDEVMRRLRDLLKGWG